MDAAAQTHYQKANVTLNSLSKECFILATMHSLFFYGGTLPYFCSAFEYFHHIVNLSPLNISLCVLDEYRHNDFRPLSEILLQTTLAIHNRTVEAKLDLSLTLSVLDSEISNIIPNVGILTSKTSGTSLPTEIRHLQQPTTMGSTSSMKYTYAEAEDQAALGALNAA
jgi:hypothetical protein